MLDLAFDLRGVIIKMCQGIATRSDKFPPSFVEKLKQCHDAVPTKPFDVIKQQVERELGRPIEQVFKSFDETPLASASLAQVHAAVLHDGSEVAVKVQYPDIEDIVRTDLANMRRACEIYERSIRSRSSCCRCSRSSPAHIGFELDFEREAKSADRVRKLSRTTRACWCRASIRSSRSERVMTMQKLQGIKITDKQRILDAGLKPREVLQDLMHIFVHMIMADGFFQADPHPGNLMVTPDGSIIVLDFGLRRSFPTASGWACSS